MERFESILGLCLIVVVLVRLLSYAWYIFRVYFLTRIGFCKNLKDYGEWAVVTGATDGIGKEYAKQLAENGLNVVLISRTKSKLEKVACEIEQLHGVMTKIVVFDFSHQEGYDGIMDELKNLNIGILVNNVGSALDEFNSFTDRNIDDVVAVVNTNLMSNVKMTHLILPGMVTRRRGVVVHVTSGSILPNIVALGVYPSTKVFLEKFSRFLQIETAGVVEHQLLIPMSVSTKGMKLPPQFTVPSSRDYVKSALKTIGVANETCGYFSHELVYIFLQIAPDSFVNFVFKNIFLPKMKKYE